MKKFKLALTILTAILLLMAVTVATYAWFSSNRTVDSSRVTARTGDEALGLMISSDGVNFKYAAGDTAGGGAGSGEYGHITQVNKSDLAYLLPVSTADLKSFVWNRFTVDSVAKSFELVENEDNFYHGRVYLKAESKSQTQTSSMLLYLDEASGDAKNIISSDSKELINASRLGLTFNSESPVIMRLSEDESADRVYNTEVNGQLLKEGQVLGYSGGKVSAAKDISASLASYTVTAVDGGYRLPENYLCRMELGKVYAIDIYFYLEGCDPDCTDKVALKKLDLNLSFYGVLSE